MPWRLSALSILLLSCACASRPRFPIGIYGVNEPAHLAAVSRAGFDSVHSYLNDPEVLARLAREGKKRGVRLVVYVDKLRELDSSFTSGWPVDAWYLVDEPDVIKMSSATVAERHAATRAWDPARKTAFVIGQGSAAKEFGGIGDILMLDWYPIPHLGAWTVADQIDVARASLAPAKPLWMVVQAYDWADESSKPGLRFPTFEELRLMSYLSVLHGASGLFYFTFTKKGRTLLDHPDLWQRVARAGTELRKMRPVFERGKRVPLPFERHPDGAEAGMWRRRGCDYLVVANRTDDRYNKVPEVLLDGWTPLFEPARDVRALTKKIGRAWYLRPGQVLVLRRD